jgi:hypothetical protein
MLYYAQGDAVITRQEFFEKGQKALPKFYDDLAAGRTPRSLSFSTGALTPGNAVRGLVPGPGAEAVPWQPIGPGKPLTVQIWEIYTGKYPSRDWLSGHGKDMLVMSAVKSIATFDAKAPTLNFLVKAVEAQSRLKRPKASEEGTPFAFYSPALLDNALTLDLSIVFDQFSPEIFETLATVFTGAGGIPVFMPYGVYLLAAGMVARLVGQAGELLFDGQPSFSASEPLDINWPGSPPLSPGFLVVTQGDVDAMDPDFRTAHHVNEQGQVVDQSGALYKGDIPYIVISVDGTPHNELASWAPTAVSSTVLSRFLRMKSGQTQAADILLDAVKLYNDFAFRKQVENVDLQISKTTDAKEKAELESKREALVKNIQNQIIKP